MHKQNVSTEGGNPTGLVRLKGRMPICFLIVDILSDGILQYFVSGIRRETENEFKLGLSHCTNLTIF